MYTSIQLKEFLQEISEEARFLKFDFDSPEKFAVLIKCKVKENESGEYYKEHVKNWIIQFSNFTNTTWLVRDSYPRAKRYLFKKTYACHLAYRASTAKPQTRNLHCKATINLKIDPHVQEGLTMTIAIEFEHTHSLKNNNQVNTRGSFNTQNLRSQAGKSVFYHFIDEGYTAAAAKSYHVLRLIEIYGDDSEDLNARIQQVQHLYNRRWKQKEINVNEVMTKKMEALEKIGHTIRYIVKPSFAVILTPLMKRVISQIGLQRVLIDATLELGAPYTLFLYVPSMIGSLPIACVIFTELNKGIYLQIFVTLKIAIQTLTGINFEPEVLLHDDDPVIKEALTIVFPSSIIILSRYSLCRDFWRWICDATVVVKPEPLVAIMLLKSLVFAKCLIEASVVHHHLMASTMPKKCFEKVDFVWLNRVQWINDNKLCDGFNDAPIYFIKEFILQLCKPFNGILPAMLDVVTNVIENHYNKILLAHRDGDVTRVYTKFIAKMRIDSNSEYVRKVGSNEYHIRDAFNMCRYYTVNTDAMCCNCSYGKKGRICEHLCALLILNNDTFVLFSSLDYNERKIFLKILGDTNTTIKSENKNDLLEIEENEIDDERFKSCSSSKESEENYDPEIKKEVQDSMETNREDEYIDEERYKSCLLSKESEENYDPEIKKEVQDYLETNHEDEHIDDERYKSCLLSKESEENYDPEIKKEVPDSMETNREDEYIDDERSKSSHSWLLSRESEETDDLEIKTEQQDSLETNYEGENIINVKFASEATSKEELKGRYEASMKCVNDEFRRLNKLFKDNPNETNLYTMQRLAKELAKVGEVVEEVDLSNMFVTLNKTSVNKTEEI